MAASTQVSLSEYLGTVYKPDCEYIDGELIERNVGEGPHSYIQAALTAWVFARLKQLGLLTLTEQRVQVAERHYRIPDICIIRREDFARIIQRPPLLCIEILSPEDRWSRVQESISDYLRFGVPEIWVIDPQNAMAWVCTPEAPIRQVQDGVLRWRDLELPFSDILPPTSEA